MLKKLHSDLSKTILVTHAECMDGSGCAIMFLRAGGRRENIKYVPAGGLEDFWDTFCCVSDSTDFDHVIIADVGLSDRPGWENYADDMERRGNVVLLDHHLTSKHLEGRPFCVIDMSCCGTELVRRHLGLNSEFNVKLSETINDNDLWLRKIPESQNLAQLASYIGQQDFIERFLWREVHLTGLFSETEKQLLVMINKHVEKSISSCLKRVHVRDVNWRDGRGVCHTTKIGYVISGEMNVSLLLNRLLAAHPEVQIACCVNFEKQSVSLRSGAGYDVTGFAKYCGGGGHAQASGHGISSHFISEVLEALHG